jgi:hypothetical protein
MLNAETKSFNEFSVQVSSFRVPNRIPGANGGLEPRSSISN